MRANPLIDKKVVSARLEKPRKYIRILHFLRKTPLSSFKKHIEKYGLAEHYLHLSIECILDTGTHIISSMGYGTPSTYEDVFKILGKHGVLPSAFVKKLKGLAGLRNILVHEYMDIDIDQVYAHLNKIGLFEEFSLYIAKFLKHESK